MNTIDAANDAFKEVQFPPSPPVVALDPEPYVDADGDDALKVWIVFKDSVNFDEMEAADAMDRWGRPILSLKRDALDALKKNGIDEHPYFFLTTESEHKKHKGS